MGGISAPSLERHAALLDFEAEMLDDAVSPADETFMALPANQKERCLVSARLEAQACRLAAATLRRYARVRK